MARFGFGEQGMVLLGTSSLQDDKSLAGSKSWPCPCSIPFTTLRAGLCEIGAMPRISYKRLIEKLYTVLHRFSPATNFRGWIFRILRNTFLSSHSGLERKMTVAMESEEGGSELAAERETPETTLIERSNRQLVQRAIDDLPSHYREVLLLCEVEEMSYQQIAEILSIPIGTVMSRLARARRAIRESFMSGPGRATYRKGLSHHRSARCALYR